MTGQETTENTVNTKETTENTVNTEEATVDPQAAIIDKNNRSGSKFYQEKLAAERQEKEKLAKQIEEMQTNQLQEKENFKQLWQNEKQKREAAENKLDGVTREHVNYLKTSAIKTEAMKLGIRPEAMEDLNMLDTSMVEIETTSTGNVNILGAKEFIDGLKEKKPFWFNKGNPPIINNAMPEGGAAKKKYTGAELEDLREKDPSAYKKYMNENYGLR